MKRSWDLKPNLLDCILEERIAPAIANLGVIVQTIGGLALVTPFPGAVSLGALGGGGAASSAPSVSGAAIPSAFYMTARGMSSFAPGNITGIASVGQWATGSGCGGGGTIQVGSGADDAGAPVLPTTASSRSNPGYNGATAPIMAYIGSVGSTATSTVSSAGSPGTQTTQTAPVPSLPPPGVVIPGSPSSLSGNPTNPMDPQSGAPRFMSGLTGRLVPTLPGGLGVQTNLTGTSPPGN
jgi:hypothetical protein